MFTVFDAVDGRDLDRTQMLSRGLITESIANRYTLGALGVAMSHKHLWETCVDINQPITVIEDDAHLNVRFSETVERWTSINDGWDFIFWGSNLDQNVAIGLLPGVAQAEFRVDHNALVANIDSFKHIAASPSLYRCWFAIGLVCYSISPKGAKYLLENVFPLRDPDHGRHYNFGIDHSVMEALPQMQAYYSIPPMAATKNDQQTSTVQNDSN